MGNVYAKYLLVYSKVRSNEVSIPISTAYFDDKSTGSSPYCVPHLYHSPTGTIYIGFSNILQNTSMINEVVFIRDIT